jgi:hypothetical protein|tara:strand:- start:185 stop:412 length:228 start_codon:yes stop_codon:yes gene_type:complete
MTKQYLEIRMGPFNEGGMEVPFLDKSLSGYFMKYHGYSEEYAIEMAQELITGEKNTCFSLLQNRSLELKISTGKD